MKTCISSYWRALIQVVRGSRKGAAVGKALVALLVGCVAALGLSVMSVKVWAACSDYFAQEEIELPFVCTELADYPGGATAYLFGFGFEPGEPVELQVERSDGQTGQGPAYEPWVATADAEGNFGTCWIVCLDCTDTVLQLYAQGLRSGLYAETLFTDAISPAIALTYLGFPYAQSFNSLANSGLASTTPAGWGFLESGTSANTQYNPGIGSSSTGDTYSFGTTTGTRLDRAFGGLRSTSLVPLLGAQFSNNTGRTITVLDIQYVGEQWRLGALGRLDRLDFQYSLNATALDNGTWINVDALDFVAPVSSGTIGALPGNLEANRTLRSATLTGLSLAPGAIFFFRWTDFDAAGADDGLAVDDFAITPYGTTLATQPADQTVFIGGAASFSVGAPGAVSYAWRKRDSGWGGGGWSLIPRGGALFMGDSAANGGTFNLGTAWGLWNNGGGGTEAIRPFGRPMAIGETFTIDMDAGDIMDPEGAAGFMLRDAQHVDRFECYARYYQSSYKFNTDTEVDTGVPVTPDRIRVALTMIGPDRYTATIIQANGNRTFHHTGYLRGNPGSLITELCLFSYKAGPDASANAYFSNIGFDARDDRAENAPYTDGWQAGDDGGQRPLADGGNISGATTPVLAIGPASLDDAGRYDVVVDGTLALASRAALLTVLDGTTPPTVTCPAGAAVDAYQAAIPDVLPGVTVTAPGGLASLAQVPAAGTVVGQGTHDITVTVTDLAGQTGTCTTTFTVRDVSPPTIACPAPMTVACLEAVPAPDVAAVVAADNSGLPPTVAWTGDNQSHPGSSCGNVITRTYQATDASGNAAPCTQTLTVADAIAPTLADVPADTTVACDAIPAPADVTAIDTCDPAPTILFSEVDGVVVGCGPIVRAWTATDACGNSASARQTLTVVDTAAPTLVGVPADATYPCPGEVPAPAEVTATDNCDPTLAVEFNEVDERINGFGTLVRTWTVADECGNRHSASQTLTVQDTIAPTIACAPNQTVSPLAAPAKFAASVALKFNKEPIAAGRTIWFSSILKIKNEGKTPTGVNIENSKIVFTANGTTYTVPVPDGQVSVMPVAAATTVFNAALNQWQTTVPKEADDHVFLTGVPFVVPVNLPGEIVATWSGDFTSDRLGVTADWKAGAAVYTSFGTSLAGLAIKPVNGGKWTVYPSSDPAGTPEDDKAFLVKGGTGDSKNYKYTGKPSASKHVIPKKKGALGSSCDGLVVFTEPTATDDCGGPVEVTCEPPSGSLLGAGVHPITCTAVDEAGNASTCTFQVTVLPPLRIVFTDKVKDDSVPDEIETDQDIQNKFKAGAKVEHRIKLYDCTGTDVTKTLASAVTLKLDVTLRQYVNATTSTLINDLPETYDNWGSAGGVLELDKDQFRYDLVTTGYPKGTVDLPMFLRSRITVEYNSSPGVVVAEEDALLESEP